MSSLGQAQTGKMRSIPKVGNAKVDDNLALVYRNGGNNHNYPFQWSSTVTMLSGDSEVTVASGIKFQGVDLADVDNCSFTFAPYGNPGGSLYVDCDDTLNIVKIKSTAGAPADVVIKVFCMLGKSPDMEKLSSRGNKGAMPSLP